MMSTAGAQALQLAPAEPVCEPDTLLPGTKAGPWIVERELGRGGMGCVYSAHHEEIGKRAALKVMHGRLVTTQSAERMLVEARVVNQVGHPNIVDIFETGTLPDGRPYIVMERLEGMPLAVRADEGKILPDQVISMLLQICDALIAAHAAGIVHRDLKLDNVFLIDNPDDPQHPRVKLLDWGIAKIISADVKHTIDGQLVGTPQYLSPEQARGAAVSAQTDVYSLGVMAYELFVEQLPFEAETSAEIMAMHLRATPPPPSELWPDIPPGLEHLILAMLAKDPEARPSMLTVAHTLELVRGEVERRRTTASMGATAAPEVPQRLSRRLSVHALAPTAPAAFDRSRPWQFVVGALAVAASITMFLLTRDSDSAAATRPTASIVEPALPRTNHSVPSITPSHVESRAMAPVALAAEPPPTAPASAPALATHAPSRSPAMHHASRKAPVTPRRVSLPLDPDGTVDPYR